MCSKSTEFLIFLNGLVVLSSAGRLIPRAPLQANMLNPDFLLPHYNKEMYIFKVHTISKKCRTPMWS